MKFDPRSLRLYVTLTWIVEFQTCKLRMQVK